MLLEVSIKNFAIIEQVSLNFEKRDDHPIW